MTIQEAASLIEIISKLMNAPLRAYSGEDEYTRSFPQDLPADPFTLYKDRLSDKNRKTTLLLVDERMAYGIVTSGEVSIVIGPVADQFISFDAAERLARNLNIEVEHETDFIQQLQSIEHHSVLSLLSIMCKLQHCMDSNTPVIPPDKDPNSLYLEDLYVPITFDEITYCDTDGERPINARLLIEDTLFNIIKTGDTYRLDNWIRNLPMRSTMVHTTGNPEQDLKIRFIIFSTMVYRASVEGGLNAGKAADLQHSYIARCMETSDHDNIVFLQQNMLGDFVRAVSTSRRGSGSHLVQDAADYIKAHLAEPIKTEDIADSLYISRSYLSTRFKQETGINLSDFIRRQKIFEARRLLTFSSYPLSQISEMLGFSSQSHLTRVFKSEVGVTPFDYRRDVRDS